MIRYVIVSVIVVVIMLVIYALMLEVVWNNPRAPKERSGEKWKGNRCIDLSFVGCFSLQLFKCNYRGRSV